MNKKRSYLLISAAMYCLGLWFATSNYPAIIAIAFLTYGVVYGHLAAEE